MTATELLKKHGIKPTKVQKANAKMKKVMVDKARIDKEKLTPGGIVAYQPLSGAPKEGSRAALMAQAKAKGIKYYRILNKDNLRKVLDPAVSADSVNGIIIKAKEEWKSGWGSKKKPEAAHE